jgi:5-methylcytosine-specific restriction endonuclease McrA
VGKDYQDLRWEVWLRDQGRCQIPDEHGVICGKFVHLHEMELDHIEGRGMGGGKRNDTAESTRCSCRDCNQRKGSKRDPLPIRMESDGAEGRDLRSSETGEV